MRYVNTMKKLEHNNSRIEILLGVIRNLLDDIATLIEGSNTLRVRTVFNITRETRRDFEYIASRTWHEGLAFLTTALPSLGKWYDLWLAGEVGLPPVGFKPYKEVKYHDPSFYEERDNFTCPLFCRTLWHVIHDTDGSVSERSNIVRAYRSLFFLFYKLEVEFTPEQLKTALDKWLLLESELETFPYPDYYDRDMCTARDIIAEVLSDGDKMFRRISPRHGPGAVAGGEIGDEKWNSFHFIPTLHKVYPWYRYLYDIPSSGRRSLSSWEMIISFVRSRQHQDAVSRLLFVPKDSRGPRTISCEPKELMFIQQGISANLMRGLHRRSVGRINFEDQSVNGHIALTSSESQAYATVDLEDASDRVSWLLVRILCPDWTHEYLQATRSHSTRLPDGTIFENHAKYAPMGSALCFPMESVIFWALAVTAGINSGLPANVAKARTYVFGDDIIIVPSAVPALRDLLARVALKVNMSKTYSRGPFRESCGVDAWKGYNVTPLKIKKDVCRRSLDGALAEACCEYSSRCFALDYRKTGEYLYNLVNDVYPGIPRTLHQRLGCLHVVDPLLYDLPKGVRTGWSQRDCRRWIEGWVVYNPKKASDLTGFSRLLKDLHGTWEFYDPGKVVVPRATKIRKRKTLVEGWPF